MFGWKEVVFNIVILFCNDFLYEGYFLKVVFIVIYCLFIYFEVGIVIDWLL